ncbi:EF-hand domain-containing protein [Pseudonocardiaceae bacterium YIM PH 21723]|nr:EF-hand domain-containing protein [Pseudonocardiaceae bacterium YIM PH 21723]
MAEIKASFQLFDTNGDGKISRQEFLSVVSAAGGDLSTAAELFAVADHNDNGEIDFTEFLTTFAAGERKLQD